MSHAHATPSTPSSGATGTSNPLSPPTPGRPRVVYTSTFATPVGDFSVGIGETGSVVATVFGDSHALARRSQGVRILADDARTAGARAQILAYFDSPRAMFSLPLAPEGSEFQKRVWAALLAIPCGETRSYGAIARELGSSARAVGRANATNPICLIVPCHRVIGADGSLAGYAYGESLKRKLLEHEGAWAASLNLT